jgi:hypothetical protein
MTSDTSEEMSMHPRTTSSDGCSIDTARAQSAMKDSEIDGLRQVLRTIRRRAMADGNPSQLLADIIDMVDQEIDL